MDISRSQVGKRAGDLSKVQDAVQVAELQQVRPLLHSRPEINS